MIQKLKIKKNARLITEGFEPLKENRFEQWKDSRDLTYVDLNDGNPLVEYKDRYYSYNELVEAIGGRQEMRSATSGDIIYLIDNDVVFSKGIVCDEGRFDWSHIDPLTGMPKLKEPRPEEKIELMNRLPAKSGWVTILQNRVNFNSVGNKRYARNMWFDRLTQTLSSSKDMEDAHPWRTYILPGAGRPGGWIYAEGPEVKLNIR